MPASLKLNGKPLQLRPASPTVQKLKAFLDKSPADELLTNSELGVRIHTHRSTIKTSSVFGNSLLRGYSAKVGPIRYWGNPKAIAELRKQVAQ